MHLLNKYYPELNLTTEDIVSAYVGVRPLMGASAPAAGSEGQPGNSAQALQKVSREHHIGNGPGSTVVVAGGKYTTHRKMAEEIVDFTIQSWKNDLKSPGRSQGLAMIPKILAPQTKDPVNPQATSEAVERCRVSSASKNLNIPEELLSRYGAEALDVMELGIHAAKTPDPEGFPLLAAQLRHSIRCEMVIRLEDFYLRRIPLYLSRADHGIPWAEELSQVWAEEMGLSLEEAKNEKERLLVSLAERSSWKQKVKT